MTIPVPSLILPDEILSIVCEELAQARDFDTLYNCSLTSRNVADPALRCLYQYHELSPTFIQSDEDSIKQSATSFKQKLKQADRSFRKWTLLWHSIVASSLEDSSTYKPYCRYLRMLDLRNLSSVFYDLKFTGAVRRDFFKRGLEPFSFPHRQWSKADEDLIAAVNAIGEAVVPKTFQLEEISGDLTSGFLTRWVPNAPKLKSIVLFRGDGLGDGAGTAIAQSCEGFRDLTIRAWDSPLADETFAQFLNELKEDTIRYFEMISVNSLQRQSFEALGRHRDLFDLRISGLSEDGVRSLGALKKCTNLHTLVLEDNLGAVQLEASENDVFIEVVEWLSACENLRDLTMKKFFDGPAILAQVLSSPQLRLKKLSVEGYVLNRQSSAAFHTAISEQGQLESLSLKGNGEDASSDDLSIMVEALSNLRNLRELFLKEISDEFEESHIITLALELTNLEEFWTSGCEISEDVLLMLASMKSLKSLTLLATTKFRAYSILDFIYKLDQKQQKGFVLSLMAQDSDYALTEEDQELIRSEIEKNVEGQFDYALWREADSDISDSD